MSAIVKSSFMKIPYLKKNYVKIIDFLLTNIRSCYWAIDNVMLSADPGFIFCKDAQGALPINSHSNMTKSTNY